MFSSAVGRALSSCMNIVMFSIFSGGCRFETKFLLYCQLGHGEFIVSPIILLQYLGVLRCFFLSRFL